MSRRSSLCALGASVAAMLTMSGALTGVTSGQALARTQQTLLPGDVVTYSRGASQPEMQRIAAYWTPERLRQASTYVPSTKPSAGTRSAPSVAEVVPSGKKAKAPGKKEPGQPPMVGKVFF